jgi:hypothetical protein
MMIGNLNLIEDKFFGFVYEDGSYSDTREARAATCVPKRPHNDAIWDHEQKCWMLGGQPITQANPAQMQEMLVATAAAEPEKLNVDTVLDMLTPEQKMELIAKLATQNQAAEEPKAPDMKDITPPAGTTVTL